MIPPGATPGEPPAISTLPSVNRVAVCPERGLFIFVTTMKLSAGGGGPVEPPPPQPMASAMPAASAAPKSPRRTREPACFRWGEMICCAAKIARFRLLGFITFLFIKFLIQFLDFNGMYYSAPHLSRGLDHRRELRVSPSGHRSRNLRCFLPP